MEDLLHATEALLREHQLWAGVVVGVIAFGESLVLIGALIPATALMMLIGGLVGSGVIGPVPVLLGSILGAAAGDIVSYMIGRWAGPGIVHKWPLNRYRTGVAKARLFFRKYGFAAVFFGRFLGPIRSTVPLVAGMMSMDQLRFQIANFGSALVWAPVMLAPGWLAARGVSQYGELSIMEWIGLSIGLTAILAAGAGLVVWVSKKIAPQPRRASRARS